MSPNHSELRYFKEQYPESVEKMFSAVSDLYAEYWNDFFHFAIFDEGTESWDEAFEYTHNRYLKALRASDAENVLELACGRGGFSNILASNTKGNVLGIDISHSQLSHAKQYKQSNLSFKHHDVMRVDDLNDVFDAIAFMDAACYLPNKSLAVEKIASVLKPGGRLLLIDWCKMEGLNSIQEELVLHPFMMYWAIPGLETPQNYLKYFEQNDLKVVQYEDLNRRVKRNWEFGYTSALNALNELSLKDVPRLAWQALNQGTEAVRLVKEQFPAAVYIKVGYDIGYLRYSYFLVEK